MISTREAATQVLVRDGQTIVLGGLVDRQRDVTSGGVPLLSEIPLLGGLGTEARRLDPHTAAASGEAAMTLLVQPVASGELSPSRPGSSIGRAADF